MFGIGLLAIGLQYELDPTWPLAGLPPAACAFSAAAVDDRNKEVHVIQRGPHMPPMLVFSTVSGRLIRTYGNRTTVTFANGTWGSHGLSIRFSPGGAEPQLWVFDFFAGKIRVFSTQGEPIATAGSAQGNSTAPLQFGNVADGAFDPAGRLAVVADGDGGVNNRVVACTCSSGDSISRSVRWYSVHRCRRRSSSSRVAVEYVA